MTLDSFDSISAISDRIAKVCPDLVIADRLKMAIEIYKLESSVVCFSEIINRLEHINEGIYSIARNTK